MPAMSDTLADAKALAQAKIPMPIVVLDLMCTLLVFDLCVPNRPHAGRSGTHTENGYIFLDLTLRIKPHLR